MNSLESPRKSVMYWHKRQTITEIKRQAPMFRQLMAQSKQCMKGEGGSKYTFDSYGRLQYLHQQYPKRTSQIYNILGHL